MTKELTAAETKDLLVELLLAKKATDVTVINVSNQTVVTEYFIIATGKSTSQVKALTEHLEEKGEEKGLFTFRKDGVREARWVVLDYGSVIVHIFNDATRDFYALEKLWGNADNTVVVKD